MNSSKENSSKHQYYFSARLFYATSAISSSNTTTLHCLAEKIIVGCALNLLVRGKFKILYYLILNLSKLYYYQVKQQKDTIKRSASTQ